MSAKKATVDKAAVARSRELQRHEATIEAAQKSFVELGRALGKIRAEQLYAVAGCQTFEEYVEERWDIGRAHAYRLINAARVALSLSPMGYKIDSERVARELAAAPDDEARARLAEEATRRADGRRLTAALVAATREEMFPGATVIDGDVVDERPAIAAAGPAPADVAPAVTQMLTEAAASIGAGIPAPAADPATVLCGGDPTHCGAGCGAPIPKMERDAGHLRCRSCDPSTLHKSLTEGDFTGQCERCTSVAARLAKDTAAVTAESPEPGPNGLGEPAGADQAAPADAAQQTHEHADEGAEHDQQHVGCEKCGRPISEDEAAAGFLRCGDCDPNGAHVVSTDLGGACGACRQIPTDSPAAGWTDKDRETAAASLAKLEAGTWKPAGSLRHLLNDCGGPDGTTTSLRPGTPRTLTDEVGHATCVHCLRAVIDSLAAAATLLPDGDGDPTPEPEQQPGHDSPPDVGSEGFPRRAETDHREDIRGVAAAPPVGPEGAMPAPPGHPDHHGPAGVSGRGEAPAPPIAVEPELEDGGNLPSPSSSDYLMHYSAQFALHLEEFDPEAIGPLMLDDDVATLLRQADEFEDFVARLIKARTP